MRAIELPERRLAGVAARRLAIGLGAVGALALGAVAVGALAVGAFAIGRLSVKKARFEEVEIGDLTVHRIRLPGDRPSRQPSMLAHSVAGTATPRAVRSD